MSRLSEYGNHVSKINHSDLGEPCQRFIAPDDLILVRMREGIFLMLLRYERLALPKECDTLITPARARGKSPAAVRLRRSGAVALLFLALCPFSQANEPDAKSIPKAILMLGLYCNAANIELKRFYERAPLAPPWNAQGKRAEAFAKVFSSLDFNLWGNAKAISDKALTQKEVLFLNLTAQKEAKIWGEHATTQCGLLHNPQDIENCLRNLNSEVFKCFQELNYRVDALTK